MFTGQKGLGPCEPHRLSLASGNLVLPKARDQCRVGGAILMGNPAENTILILDDDGYFRSLIVELLSSHGYSVTEARSASEASQIVESNTPFLAIVDYKLPEMDGITWITKIKEAGHNFPVVFLSGSWCDSNTFHKLRNVLRVSLVLQKPIVPELFVQQIASLLPLPPGQRPGTVGSMLNSPSAADDLSKQKDPRRGKLAVAKTIYVKALADTWHELSRLIASAQSEPPGGAAFEQAFDIAHKIKGTAGSYGLKQIADSAGKLEDLFNTFEQAEAHRYWRKIVSEHANGADILVELIHSLDAAIEPENDQMATKILLLGKSAQYQNQTKRLHTLETVEVELAEEPASAATMAGATNYGAAIIDLALAEKEQSIAAAKAIRLAAGTKALPLAFIWNDRNPISKAELAFAGSSTLLPTSPQKAHFEAAIDKLLTLSNSDKPRILTVDDDENLTRLIARGLFGYGMLVRALSDPTQIIEVVQDFHPDLVLLDVIMPGLSGYDVCRMLRETKECETTPIVFLTSKNDHDGRTAAFRAGGDDFLSKPLVTAELVARVRSHLDHAIVRTGSRERDALTGVMSRKIYLREATRLLDNAGQQDMTLSVALITIDAFADLVLTHGITAMEAPIVSLGQLIFSRFKAEDIRGRWGDSGFALAFRNEDQSTMGEAVQMLLEEFNVLRFTSSSGQEFGVSFSAGLASHPTDGSSLKELLTCANQRLLANTGKTGAIASAMR
jgi:diguanylate cyclase (GGDEF)-like protein